MTHITYHKLIRDKVPQRIADDGKTASTKTLSDDDVFEDALRGKLVEELDEVLVAKDADELQTELADLLEAMYAYAAMYRISPEQIETTRIERLEERGGFDLRLLLERVEDTEA